MRFIKAVGTVKIRYVQEKETVFFLKDISVVVPNRWRFQRQDGRVKSPWECSCVHGMENNQLIGVDLKAPKNGLHTILYKGKMVKVKLKSGIMYHFDGNLNLH